MAWETATWICRNCNAHFAFDEVEAHFFVCRACDYRNRLVNTGPDAAGRPRLIQRDE
jgi:hypothetical protein